MIGIAYHNYYNRYDLGLRHPLIGDKPKKTMDFLREKKILNNIKVFKPKKVTEKDLLRVHSKSYVEKIKKLSKTGGVLSIDTPVPIGIYDISRLAAGGTKLAGEKLFEGFNIMANPLAGFHHASKSFSSGFCFFNDVAIAVEYLRERYDLKKIMIIDLDVHHANGTQEIYYNDPSVLNISFHQDGRTLYPGTGSLEKIGDGKGEGYTVNLPLPPKTGSQSYIKAFDNLIPILVKQFSPEIIIYQSGVDTHYSDPLADLCLTFNTYYHLAKKIGNLSKDSCDKLLVLFGGGYNSDSSVICYYNIMCGLLKKMEFIKEKDIPDEKISEVEKLINKLKEILSPYWDY